MFSYIIGGIFLFLFLTQGILAVYFQISKRKNRKFINSLPDKKYAPVVSVILPFKGCDCNLEQTVKSLLNQNYEGKYSLYFVSSEEDSKAVRIVKKLVKNYSNAHFIKAVKDEVSKYRSDKVNNLLNGVRKATEDTEVYLFIDSDIVPYKDWISHMVKPLQAKACGVTTGSAWIVSEKKDTLLTLAARYWDFLATTMITFPFTKFARGFSFGLRKETFEKIGMRNVWENAFHDNFTLSTAIRKHKMRILYIPGCLVSEYFSITGFEWIKWVKRQAINTKVNFKKLWAFGFFLVTMPRLIGAVGFIIAAILKMEFQQSNPIITVMLWWPIIFGITSFLVIAAVYPERKNYRDYPNNIVDLIKLFISAYVSVVYCISSLWAVVSNKMEWRQLFYHEKTPYTTTTIDERKKKE